MTSYSTGREAEQEACRYLIEQGYQVIDNNWKTKYCEIDIIAKKSKTVVFVEVKYRKNNTYGSGFDYITDKKLNQMRYTANSWIAMNNYKDQCCLAAIELSGTPPKVNGFIDNIII